MWTKLSACESTENDKNSMISIQIDPDLIDYLGLLCQTALLPKSYENLAVTYLSNIAD